MIVSHNSRIIIVGFILSLIMLIGDSKPISKDKRQLLHITPKWFSDNASDILYVNKSVVDMVPRELDEVIYNLSTRPARSPGRVPPANYLKVVEKITQDNSYKVSRVDINFVNEDNVTVHTIQLQPNRKVKMPRLPAYVKKLNQYF
ncbi:hypothetical protein B5X24_HaOG209417 [Helicoverpa armigera]|uniref:Uncharacterized protein n=1 Tax=Helicoverpa armigera TaxID=29058 RepID=A0A2W1BEE3_HELAM|nr:hypothetical protein B5X24_HaOG209417 [Helicoverpa armigera]